MRLARLDLTRYGKFTDFSIDFGEASPGAPDLHVIYGPNEAGKSTSFSAYLDLLFGIEQRTRYAFLHPYATMRVGGVLELDGTAKELIRIKRPQNSLLGANAQPVDEATALGGLRSIDREAYRTMFSLDDDSIEAGGESILASKGDLGQLLFSASAGLAHLSQALSELRAEADGFYKYRARSGELVELKGRLATLKERRETIDTLAIDYGRLVEARETAQAQYEITLGERSAIQARMEEIRRILNAIPRLGELHRRREALASLEGLPQPPTHWAVELPRLQKSEIELAAKREAIAAEAQALENEISGIVVDERALALASQFEYLGDLRAGYGTAARDLPDLRLAGSELAREIGFIVRSLDWSGDASELVLDAVKLARLRDLMEKRSGIDAATASARTEYEKAERLHAEAERRAADSGLNTADAKDTDAAMGVLAAVLATCRADDHMARKRLAERARSAHEDVLAERLLGLRPWNGNLDDLTAMNVPIPREIESWAAGIAEAERNLLEANKEVARLASEQGRLREELRAVAEATGMVSDQEAAAVRAEREQAWAKHRATLDLATADTFEASLRKDDIVASIRLGRAAEAERLNQTARSLAIIDAAMVEQLQAQSAAAEKLQATRERIGTAWRNMSSALPADTNPSSLLEWLRQRDHVLEVRRELRQAERDLRKATEEGSALAEQLARALQNAEVAYPVDASLELLKSLAQSALDKEGERSALRRRVIESREERRARADLLAKAERDEAAWSMALADACRGTWLDGRVEGVAGLRTILPRLADLEAMLRDRAGLADRSAKMERDQAIFVETLGQFARELDIATDKAVVEAYREVSTRIEQARLNADLLADRSRLLEDVARRAAEIEMQAAVNASQVAEMTALFEVETLNEVAERLRGVDRRTELLGQAGALEIELLELLGVSSLDEVETLLMGTDRSSLELELTELKARFEDQDQRSRELFNAMSRAAERVEQVGGDDAVARIEQERRTLLMDIEEKARGYFRLRAGTAAAEAALQCYRERHRSAMMERASAAFATISRGAYAGLSAQPERDSEILIAKAADGTSKVASDLSRGTRFQLYLALRVAGYLEFAKARRPVPFVADDIMETFDDFRAEEALRLFGEMSKVGQVIYLTHHQHLCDIAQRVCPGARIHELPNAARTRN